MVWKYKTLQFLCQLSVWPYLSWRDRNLLSQSDRKDAYWATALLALVLLIVGALAQYVPFLRPLLAVFGVVIYYIFGFFMALALVFALLSAAEREE